MSQYDPNLNEALVNARLAARAAEASRSRLAAGKSRRERTSKRRRAVHPVNPVRQKARANDVAQADPQPTLIR